MSQNLKFDGYTHEISTAKLQILTKDCDVVCSSIQNMNIMEGYNQAYFRFFTSENEHCDRLVKGILTDQVFTVWSRQKKLNGSSNSGARV